MDAVAPDFERVAARGGPVVLVREPDIVPRSSSTLVPAFRVCRRLRLEPRFVLRGWLFLLAAK